MSYDLDLFLPEPGVDPKVTATRLFLQNGDEEQRDREFSIENILGMINPGPPRPEFERRKQEITQLLIKYDPQLTIFPFDYARIAQFHGISEEDAKTRFRHLELNQPETGHGIQITLFDTTISITIPYWHEGDAAYSAFQEIWGYLELLYRQVGYLAYDPQLNKVLDLENDLESVLYAYGGTIDLMHQTFHSPQ